MRDHEDFYMDFKPELTPKQMLEYGVFGGSYLGNTINEYPKSWFKKAKISKFFNVDLNCFKIRSGQSLKEWKKKRLDNVRRSKGLVSVVLPIHNRKAYSKN